MFSNIADIEFKVERRDSIGMVAKEHTKKIMKESGALTGKESNQLSTLDGNSGSLEKNSISSRGEDEKHPLEGLERTEIQKAEVRIGKESTEFVNVTDFKCEKTMGGMSFGEQANPFEGTEVSWEDSQRDKSYS